MDIYRVENNYKKKLKYSDKSTLFIKKFKTGLALLY